MSIFINFLQIESRFTCERMNEIDTKGGMSASILNQLNIWMNGKKCFAGWFQKIDLYKAFEFVSVD